MSSYARGDHVHTAETAVRRGEFKLKDSAWPVVVGRSDGFRASVSADGSWEVLSGDPPAACASGTSDPAMLVEIGGEIPNRVASVYTPAASFLSCLAFSGDGVPSGLVPGSGSEISSLGGVELTAGVGPDPVLDPDGGLSVQAFVRGVRVALAGEAGSSLAGRTYSRSLPLELLLSAVIADLGGELA